MFTRCLWICLWVLFCKMPSISSVFYFQNALKYVIKPCFWWTCASFITQNESILLPFNHIHLLWFGAHLFRMWMFVSNFDNTNRVSFVLISLLSSFLKLSVMRKMVLSFSVLFTFTGFKEHWSCLWRWKHRSDGFGFPSCSWWWSPCYWVTLRLICV